MKKKISNTTAFYTHLGKLFYAVALADKKLQEGEFRTLKNELSTSNSLTELLALDKEVDGKHYILSAFTLMFADKIDPRTCYDDFIAFKTTNEHLFTDSLQKRILKIAGKIASSFSDRNKSELIMLAKLSLEFTK
ncbi:hypothetical protein [Kordia sp.]|uniref:hypothetical protein n=1 Tax=Kordia sp. TaxID=1965332 RepID=UPI003B5C7B15